MKALLFPLAALATSVAFAAGPLYPETARAEGDVAAAVQAAAKSGKRVLVDFGGNWCGDCKVLDMHLRKPERPEVGARLPGEVESIGARARR